MVRSKTTAERMREEARDAILEAALSVFGDKGFAGATTAEVASAAGVSKGLIFNYFPTKDALLEALIERTLGASLRFWEEADWSGAPADQLSRILDVAIAQVLEKPKFYRLYFSLVLQPGGSGAAQRAIAKVMPRLQTYFGRTERLMAELGSDEPALDAKVFQLAVNGLAQTLAAEASLVERPDVLPIEKLKARVLARLIPPYVKESK